MEILFTFINYFIGSILVGSFFTYVWIKLIDKQFCRNKIKQYLLLLFIVTCFLALKQYIAMQDVRLIINVIGLIIINYLVLSRNIKSSVISVLVSEVILLIAELIFAVFYSFITGDNNTILYTSGYNGIVINCLIAIIAFGIFKIANILKLATILIDYSRSTKNKWIGIYSIFFLIWTIFSTCSSYLGWNPVSVLIINIVVICLFIFTVFRYILKQQELEKISHKYQTSISSLKEYEVMINKFRINMHENKNEFLTIRNMIKDGETAESVVKYIDKLIDNKIEDNDKIMKKTAKIPSGGLRATIYSKLCLMDKLKIKYILNISREIRTTNLIDLDEELVLKICKILGVFLDNAIEAVKKLRKREILIYIYSAENTLCIDITNNFKGKLDLEKIGNAKYTTKGENHGYGLALVNQLLDEEKDKLENERSINKDTFTQTLKIKI